MMSILNDIAAQVTVFEMVLKQWNFIFDTLHVNKSSFISN